MARMMLDCRGYPSEKACSIAISGEEKEVIEAGVQHAMTVHGEKDTPELRKWVRESLKAESSATWSPAGRIDADTAPEVTH